MRACSHLGARHCDCCPAACQRSAERWQGWPSQRERVSAFVAMAPVSTYRIQLCSPRSLPRSQCNAMTTTRRFAYFEHGLSAVATASHSTSFARRRSSTSRSCRRSCASDVTFCNLVPRNGRTRHHTTCRRRHIVQALELEQAGRRWPPHGQRRTRPRGARWSCKC